MSVTLRTNLTGTVSDTGPGTPLSVDQVKAIAKDAGSASVDRTYRP